MHQTLVIDTGFSFMRVRAINFCHIELKNFRRY